MRLIADELEATKAKIAKINARAERRGFTGRIDLDVTEERVTTTNEIGLEITQIFYETKIIGDAPSYDGWTFAATLTWDEAAGLVTRCAPGVTSIDRDGLRDGWCDHCKTDRYRTNTYLVINDATGQRCQVGSTCIKDFLGWSTSPVFLDTISVTEEIENMLGAGNYGDRRWDTLTVLAVAWASVQAFGFVRADSYNATPTKEVVRAILDPHSRADRELAQGLHPHVADAYRQAKIIREYILSDDFDGRGEYVINMKAVIRAETIGNRNIGLVASAPQAWARGMERDLIRRTQAEELINEYIGQPKDKITVKAIVKSIRYSANAYGTSTVYTLVTADKHTLVWFASRSALGDEIDGKEYTLTATIKKHDEYQGAKRTHITRAKIV